MPKLLPPSAFPPPSALCAVRLTICSILADIKSTSPTVYSRPKPWAMFVPIGSQGKGYAAMVVPVFGVLGMPSFVLKTGKAMKLLLPELFYSTFKGPEQLPAISAEPKL